MVDHTSCRICLLKSIRLLIHTATLRVDKLNTGVTLPFTSYRKWGFVYWLDETTR